MAWSDPTANLTFATAEVATAAKLNLIRDDLLETAPAKITGGTATYIVGTAANTITERTLGQTGVQTAETTTSTSYTDLATAGPTVTATTGTRALIFMKAILRNNTAASASYASINVSGATTTAADDANGFFASAPAANYSVPGATHVVLVLTAGSNTFKMQYRVSANTGTFLHRLLVVMPF